MKISSFLSFSDPKIRTRVHTNFSQSTDFLKKSVHVRIIIKNRYIYGSFKKSVYVRIILKDLYGLIYKCSLSGPHM